MKFCRKQDNSTLLIYIVITWSAMGTFAKWSLSYGSEASNHHFIGLEIGQIHDARFQGSINNLDEGKLVEVELLVIYPAFIQTIVDPVAN